MPWTRPGATDAEVEIGDDRARVRNGDLVVEVYDNHEERFVRFPPLVRFLRADGEELFGESVPHFTSPPQRRYRRSGGDLYGCEVTFDAYPAERFYGLGQHQHGLLDQKGAVIDLVQRNTEVSVPFALSSRGYGFLWNMPGVGRVELGANRTRWAADAARQIDYWVTTGPTPADIVSRYARVTGLPPMLPEWASGFWQSKLRYRDQDELLEVAREYKRRGLPLSVIVCDYFHWTRQGEWRFDPAEWPDPQAMVDELRELGVELMVSVWPTVNPNSDNYAEMDRRGLLVRNMAGLPLHLAFWDKGTDGQAFMRFYDATNPEARRYVWEKITDGYRRYGIRAFWLDACEPEILADNAEGARYFMGQGSEVQGIYPREHARGFYEGLRASGEDDVLLLCRSAWAGSQRYGAAVWSGDIESTFEALAAQIPAGLNMGISGIPWWTTDIGGFRNGDPTTAYFRELVVRWFQFGAFCPLFRLHGVREPGPLVGSGQTGARQRSVVVRRGGLRLDPRTAGVARADPPVRHGADGDGQRHRASPHARALPRVPGGGAGVGGERPVHVRPGRARRPGDGAGSAGTRRVPPRGGVVARRLDGGARRGERLGDGSCAARAHPGLPAGGGRLERPLARRASHRTSHVGPNRRALKRRHRRRPGWTSGPSAPARRDGCLPGGGSSSRAGSS